MDKPQIVDQQGQEQDWDWLIANFGAISLERAEAPAGVSHLYRIVRLQDSEGPAVQVVIVVDQDGNPLGSVKVVRHWPDAPPLPAWPPPTSMWRDRGVYGETNFKGEIGFGMGQGDYYFPPSGGASSLWVADEAGPSDFISGLGMLGATNHRHLDVHYEVQAAEEPSPPPPPEPPPEPPPSPPGSSFDIFDQYGQPQDPTWLEHYFGTVEHYVTPEPDAYRLVELQEVVDVHEFQVRVLDEGGNPLAGIPLSFRRRDGMGGRAAETGADGIARFPLEDDAKYPVPGQGPYLAVIKADRGNSDAVIGLGRVMGTPRHLDVTLKLVPGAGPPQPVPPPQPAAGFAVFDKDGQPQDLAWLERYFGKVDHHVTLEPDAYRLLELREVVDVQECQVKILDEDGNPLAGIPVSYRRRDGTAGRVEETGTDGTARFPLESDAKYPVPGQGPYLAMVKQTAGNSDAVIGLGQVLGTTRHLDLTFKFTSGEAPAPEPPPEPEPEPEPPPPPPPEPEPEPPPPETFDEFWDQLMEKLDTIITMLEAYVEE